MATGNILAEGNLDKLKLVSVSVDFPSISANTTGTSSVTVPGVRNGMFVWANMNNLPAGVGIVSCAPNGNDAVNLRLGNFTAGALDPAAQTVIFLIASSDVVLNAF